MGMPFYKSGHQRAALQVNDHRVTALKSQDFLVGSGGLDQASVDGHRLR